MIQFFQSLFLQLSARRRWQLAGVLGLMALGALAELVTLGAIVPFLALLVNPELADRSAWFAGAWGGLAQLLGISRVAAAGLLFGLLALGAAAVRLLLTWTSYRVVFAVGADLGALVFSKVIHQPYAYHLARNSSETLAAVDKVAVLIAGVLAPLMQLTVAGVMVLAILAAMLWVNPWVACLAGGLFGGMYMGISLWARRSLLANSQRIAQGGTRRIQYLQEGMGAIRDMALDHNQALYVEQFTHVDRGVRRAQAVNLSLATAPKYVVESVAMVLVVGIALWLVQGPGGLAQALPVLGAMALGGQRMLPHVQAIYNGYASFKGGWASSQETLALLSLPLPPVVSNETTACASVESVRSLTLRDVSFAYGADSAQVLTRVSLEVRASERVGIVGKSGDGKSTLIDLCMGLLRPTAGAVLVNGQALDDAGRMRAWQRRIAHVPQSIFLCDKSIAENIAFGVPPADVDTDRLRAAVEMAQLGPFIKQLPHGLSTPVGERGIQLSGGQRQRIGIARALYKKADVLVLDEATSALDDDTERLVMQAINSLRPDLIVLMVAHRVSTLSGCSRILSVQNGSVHSTELTVEDAATNSDHMYLETTRRNGETPARHK